MAGTGEDDNWTSLRFTARDGLTIHVRCYRSELSRRRALVCIPGLTRNARDFHVLAARLASEPSGRTVYAIDLRGRGQSDHDPDWRNYVVPIEALDVLDLITAANIAGAHVLGTSRGGLIAMVMSALQPGAIGSVVLNDIGPVIEQSGLLRISSYVGRMPLPKSWPEAAELVRQGNERFFPRVKGAEWEAIARQWYNERDGAPAPGYDPKLARTFSVKDGKIPPLWDHFAALKGKPVLVIRGALSDILTAGTVEEMCRRHPACASHTVGDEGHAPLLQDTETIEAIRSFLNAADKGQPISGRTFAATKG
ncbi:MAG: hypothetical protein RLZ98_1050 [Pseudomonadota bacterium]|jgi:pimeloyl-ACP methyl ester carboxylesterase